MSISDFGSSRFQINCRSTITGFQSAIRNRQLIRNPLDPRSEIVDCCLLADAEPFEDVAEQIVAGALAGDLLQRGAGFLKIEQRKFFGDFRFERRGRARQGFSRAFEQNRVADVGDLRTIAKRLSGSRARRRSPRSDDRCRRPSSPKSRSASTGSSGSSGCDGGRSILFHTTTRGREAVTPSSSRSSFGRAAAIDRAARSSRSATPIAPRARAHAFLLDDIRRLANAGRVDQRQRQPADVRALRQRDLASSRESP